MPGPNSGKTGRICLGSARKRGVQPTEEQRNAAIKKYVERSNKRAESHVKTERNKMRRQLAKVEEDAA